MEKVSVTVRLDEDTVAFLDKLGEVEDRDRSYLVRKAVANFVEVHRWQIEEIEKAVKEADEGLFASDEEVEQAFGKWTS
jgi:predicted transcriptional regulator